jgi:hypothetical protein
LVVSVIRLFMLVLFLSAKYIPATGQEKDSGIKLEYFNKIPAQIDGCSGLYTYDATILKKRKYIFICDLQLYGLIKGQW